MTDEAIAVSEVAKATGKAIDVVSGIGRYAAEIFGDLPKDAIGILGDRLKHRRIENAAVLEERTRAKLAGIDPSRLSDPSPSVFIPLLTAAADEERESLRTLWASLLANAAIDGGGKVRREFFETLRQMEPIDAVVLEVLQGNPGADQAGNNATAIDIAVRNRPGGALPPVFDVQISLEALQNLRCALSAPTKWVISPYGRAFLRACTVE
jgi:hypothetical protein